MTERRPRRLDSDALWEYALRVLGGRAQSISELREKLRGRAERMQDVNIILSRLKQYGYLDDRRFAADFAANRLESQGFGKARVLRDLQQRKVARRVAEEVVQQAYRETDEASLIEDFLRRKFRKVRLGEFLAQPKNLASAYRKLRLAGFSSGNAIRVLQRYAREPELLDSLETPEEPLDAPPSEP